MPRTFLNKWMGKKKYKSIGLLNSEIEPYEGTALPLCNTCGAHHKNYRDVFLTLTWSRRVAIFSQHGFSTESCTWQVKCWHVQLPKSAQMDVLTRAGRDKCGSNERLSSWNQGNRVKHFKCNRGESKAAKGRCIFLFFSSLRPKWEISSLALGPRLIKTYHYSCHVGTQQEHACDPFWLATIKKY